MPDPKQEQKHAFHYALENMEDLSRAHLRELNSEQLQEIVVACDRLRQWAEDMWTWLEA